MLRRISDSVYHIIQAMIFIGPLESERRCQLPVPESKLVKEKAQKTRITASYVAK